MDKQRTQPSASVDSEASREPQDERQLSTNHYIVVSSVNSVCSACFEHWIGLEAGLANSPSGFCKHLPGCRQIAIVRKRKANKLIAGESVYRIDVLRIHRTGRDGLNRFRCLSRKYQPEGLRVSN